MTPEERAIAIVESIGRHWLRGNFDYGIAIINEARADALAAANENVRKANVQADRFEREWSLNWAELEATQAENARLRADAERWRMLDAMAKVNSEIEDDLQNACALTAYMCQVPMIDRPNMSRIELLDAAIVYAALATAEPKP